MDLNQREECCFFTKIALTELQKNSTNSCDSIDPMSGNYGSIATKYFSKIFSLSKISKKTPTIQLFTCRNSSLFSAN